MDALAVLTSTNRQVLFLARGDFFYNWAIDIILRFLKILPAYRKQEGMENITRNYETFDLAKKWLMQNRAVCIFPEGGHQGVWQLRNLSKGLFRLAIDTQKELNSTILYIVPVFIYYTSYTKWGSTLYLRFGNPISMEPYFKESISNVAKSVNHLKQDVEMAMKANMIHIEKSDYYSFIHDFSSYIVANACSKGCSEVSKIRIKEKFVIFANQLIQNDKERLNEAVVKFAALQTAYPELYTFPPQLIFKRTNLMQKIIKLIGAIAMLPLLIAFVIYFSIPFLIVSLLNHNISDRQFHSSVRYIFFFCFMPIWHIFAFIVLKSIFHSYFYSLIIVLIFIFLGFKGYYLTDFYKEILNRGKIFVKRKEVDNFIKEIRDIIQLAVMLREGSIS
jgi:hypothetical protein